MPVVQKLRRLCLEVKEISWTQLKEVGISPGLSWKISSVIRRYSFVHDYLVHLFFFEWLSGWVECCLKLHNQNTFICPYFNDSRVYIRKLYSNIAECPLSFFWDMVSLCMFCCPHTHSVDQNDLELRVVWYGKAFCLHVAFIGQWINLFQPVA